VVNRLPKGADKVLASVGAETTVEGRCGKDEGTKELSRKTRNQQEQVVHKQGLAQPQYLEIFHQNKPLELVFRFYEDPSIEERNRVAAGKYPDIGAAADSMANINGLNIVKIKYERLDKWLPLANFCSSAYDSMVSISHKLRNLKCLLIASVDGPAACEGPGVPGQAGGSQPHIWPAVIGELLQGFPGGRDLVDLQAFSRRNHPGQRNLH
jgi:hypothetical protein